jgi:hypothetical protein
VYVHAEERNFKQKNYHLFQLLKSIIKNSKINNKKCIKG